VAEIEAKRSVLLPPLRGALPRILSAARSDGIAVLQIEASFANPDLQVFASRIRSPLAGHARVRAVVSL
jgi:hypothetical protein